MFGSTTGPTGVSDGDGYNSTSTVYSDNFESLYSPVWRNTPSWTIRSYIGTWRWRKCATGSCSSYVERGQSLNTGFLEGPSFDTMESILRIPKVYVDRPTTYVAYTLRDQYGSPRFNRGDLSVVASIDSAISGSPVISSYSCSMSTVGTNSGGNTRWVYYCSITLGSASFDDSGSVASLLLTLSRTGSTSVGHVVGDQTSEENNRLQMVANMVLLHLRQPTLEHGLPPLHDIAVTAVHPVRQQELQRAHLPTRYSPGPLGSLPRTTRLIIDYVTYAKETLEDDHRHEHFGAGGRLVHEQLGRHSERLLLVFYDGVQV